DLSLRVDERGHFHLAVHIADVSHYVKPGSHLDNEAKKRCNSTYLPGTVIPMLPHELSSNLCSLMPKVDRFAVSVMMEMDSKGEVVDYSFGRSVIHSNKRFSYEEAYEVLKGKESPHKELLENLVKLCHVLKKRRSERGSIEFALPDTQLRLDSKGMPTHVEIVEYDITHQLVEECMLAANALVAKHLTSKNRPLAYRVHDEPFDEKMKDFAATVTALGYKLSPKPEAEELQLFFDEVRETALGKFFATLFIRTMKMAIYSTDNIGHFGLSLEHYTHFTSPIRRYVDLMVHRALLGEPVDDLDDIAEACSEKERLSARAEGSVLNLKKLRYLQMKAKNRDHFEAVVTAVKPNGFVFEVGEFLLEGFVPLAAFEDHFSFDASTMSVKSRRDSYKTGDRIEVYPDEIDLITQDVVWSIY
ncbi:MAG: ribonuclease R, partial [Chlamydiae bacterium]|nr:ribonuclease R [Chlamydiota bacterium]